MILIASLSAIDEKRQNTNRKKLPKSKRQNVLVKIPRMKMRMITFLIAAALPSFLCNEGILAWTQQNQLTSQNHLMTLPSELNIREEWKKQQKKLFLTMMKSLIKKVVYHQIQDLPDYIEIIMINSLHFSNKVIQLRIEDHIVLSVNQKVKRQQKNWKNMILLLIIHLRLKTIGLFIFGFLVYVIELTQANF